MPPSLAFLLAGSSLLLLSLPAGVAAQTTCRSYQAPVRVGSITQAEVNESSGLAASRKNPGVWWMHNDSGGKPRLYAFQRDGKYLGYFDLPGAKNTDWEDMAAGPCPDGSPCLYIGDIGDNPSTRPSITIYRLPEPTVDPKGSNAGQTAPPDVFEITYPDGSHNCETLLVHPKTRDILLVTKTFTGQADVYLLPGTTPPGKVTLQKVSTLSAPGDTFTGGDFSPHGDQIVLRTYAYALLYAPGADGIPKESQQFARLAMPSMTQAEAIAYSADGTEILTTTENLPAPIFSLACAATPEPTPEPKAEPTPEPKAEASVEPLPPEPTPEPKAEASVEPPVKELPPDGSPSDGSPTDGFPETPPKDLSLEKRPEVPPESAKGGCSCTTSRWDAPIRAWLLFLALWLFFRFRIYLLFEKHGKKGRS